MILFFLFRATTLTNQSDINQIYGASNISNYPKPSKIIPA